MKVSVEIKLSHKLPIELHNYFKKIKNTLPCKKTHKVHKQKFPCKISRFVLALIKNDIDNLLIQKARNWYIKIKAVLSVRNN